MNKDAGTLLYKCKICGKIVDGKHVDKMWDICFGAYTENWESYRTHPMLLFRTHECEDGAIGVLELVGGRPDRVHKDE